MLKKRKLLSLALSLCVGISVLAGCSAPQEEASTPTTSESDNKIVIGFSMDTLKEERWQKDRDIFVAAAEKMGAEVLVQAANGVDSKQLEQAENLLAQGVDVLVVVPHNGKISKSIVDAAHAEGVKVIAYDRMIEGDVDYYMAFDNERVGEMQAEYVVDQLGIDEGKFVYIGGAETDSCAFQYKDGAMRILEKYPNIEIVYNQFSHDWQPSEAQKHVENALTAEGNNVDAVICANDGTAGGALAALAEQQLQVPVTGQDAELAACQRIVEGKQSMTVYLPLHLLAEKAAEVAVDIAKGNDVATNSTVQNETKEVPSVLIEAVSVDKNNMVEEVIKSGFHSFEDVYRNVPEDERPAVN